MTSCKKVRYSGRVQGVGFRYTAQQLAAGLPVAGYVRNLANGDVELVVEGEIEDIDAFLASVAHTMSDYIKKTNVQNIPPSGLTGFRVRH
jgi:acylphosphatase